ncbi:MAG: B12-binding domain-containing radical SAM protein, partial [Steroidobacteraceae bacterium]
MSPGLAAAATSGPRILLINPTITARRNARFPLAILSLSRALESRFAVILLDGNIDREFAVTATRLIREQPIAAVGMTVMGGPQLRFAIAASKAIRRVAPAIPIVWGGAFPTNCPDAALRSPYVDFVVPGQGEETLASVLDAVLRRDLELLPSILGLSWRREDAIVHNPARPFSSATLATRLPVESLPAPSAYLPATYLGRRTAGYQAALGCRFRCTFCGVAGMFQGKT